MEENETTTTHLLDGTLKDVEARIMASPADVPSWSDLRRQYEPRLHGICTDAATRRDKRRSDGGIDKASRIHLGLEKLLTARINEFMFTIPVKRIYSFAEDTERTKEVMKSLEAIYSTARIDSENKRRGLACFASCQVLTIWYAVDEGREHTRYGFPTRWKLRCRTYSPMEGARIYPYFDAYGDLKALTVRYRSEEEQQEVEYTECWTEDRHRVWRSFKGEEAGTCDEPIALGKIPGIYLSRKRPVWDGLSHIREEIEYAISRHSDVVAYNSSPILKVVGDIEGREDKGESQRVYRVSSGGDVAYVAWSQGPEAMKYHIETLMNMFWTQGQMPDISFAQMKGLGNIGYDARQTLLMDAHLKVGEESDAWVEFLDRELNVLKAYLRLLRPEWEEELDGLRVEHIITPFRIKDELAEVQKWTQASGGKPLVSHLEAIQGLDFSADPARTMEQINKEAAEASASEVQSAIGAYE